MNKIEQIDLESLQNTENRVISPERSIWYLGKKINEIIERLNNL